MELWDCVMLPSSEWILLSLLAVILLKPEDIPAAARFLAKIIRSAQRFWKNIDILELEKHMTEQREEITQKKHPFHISPTKAKSQPVKD